MFTGIIEEKGKIIGITKGAQALTFEIEVEKILEDMHLGDSIAVNGVCLTVTHMGKKSFSADAVHETLRRTSLGQLRIGSFVNVERALQVSSRLGGHIVSGHVDCTGKVLKKRPDGMAILLEIEIPKDHFAYIVEKGSVTIEGISLTVAQRKEKTFLLSLIPHTMEHTTLKEMTVGQTVNIETDIIGKYIFQFMEERNKVPAPSRIWDEFMN